MPYIGATTESRSAAGRHHRTFHDGLEFLECEGIHVGIQEVPGDEAYLSSERDLKFVVQRKELEQVHRLLDNHEDIYIALRRILVAGDRSKDTGVLHVVTFENWGCFRRGAGQLGFGRQKVLAVVRKSRSPGSTKRVLTTSGAIAARKPLLQPSTTQPVKHGCGSNPSRNRQKTRTLSGLAVGVASESRRPKTV